VSSLTDRTDGFRVVDAPTKLTIDPEWARQFEVASNFVGKLKRNCFATFSRTSGNVTEALEDMTFSETMSKAMDLAMEHHDIDYWAIPENERMRMGISAYESQTLHVSLKDVTRLFLTLLRKGSYSWHHSKCVSSVTKYQEICQKLEPYSDMVTMPALEVPEYDASKALPFMTEILYATKKWKDRLYDHENQKVMVAPHNCVQLSLTDNQRRILTPVRDDGRMTLEVPELIGLYDADYLVYTLDKIIEEYDIERKWLNAQNCIGSLVHTFYPVSED